MRILVPFGGNRDQLAVAVPRRNIGDDRRWQRATMVQLFSPPFDVALVCKFGKHALEDDAVSVLQTESARYFARSDLAGLAADERKEFVLGRLGCLGCRAFHAGVSRNFRLFGQAAEDEDCADPV